MTEVLAALDDAQRSTPSVRAAALMRIARVQGVSDPLAARATFDTGLAEARVIEGRDGESLMEDARMLAAAVAPDRLKNIGTTALMRAPVHEQALSRQIGTIMIEHGHVDAAFEYAMNCGPAVFPFDLAHSLMERIDGERRPAIFRRAIEEWRMNRNDCSFDSFPNLFRAKWELLPPEDAKDVVREIVHAALEDPDHTISAKYGPEDTPEITSGREHKLFEMLHILQHLDQPLADSLIAGHEQLAGAARRFPNGMESVRQEAEVRRKNAAGEKRGGGFIMGGDPRDFPYLRALIQASQDGNFEPVWPYAMERYREDTSPESPNQALKSSWPSSCMFCRIIYEAGKRSGEQAVNYVGQIPDADLRLFARIELAAALTGLPQLRMTQRGYRPRAVNKISRSSRMMLIRLVVALIAVSVLVRAATPDTRLMDLNVIAVDSNQQPVTDLTRDEFRITDEGKNQPIAFFRHVSGKPAEQPAPGPGEYTNGGRANARHVTVILLDMLNQPVSTESLAADMMVRQLSSMEDTDDLFLYALGLDGKLSPIHGLDDAKAGEHWTSGIKPLMDESMRTLRKARPGDTNIINVRIDLTFRALNDLATQLSVFPGRKNLVWITDGIPATLRGFQSQNGQMVDYTASLRQLAEQFAAAGTVIYPVRQFIMGGSSENGGPGSIVGLTILTDVTGGRPEAGNDIGSAVQQAMRDVRSNYQIGYYPPDDNPDGKFHNLRVTCTRKGVRIQARAGYLALTEPAGARADRATAVALKSQAQAAEIGLRAQLTADPKAANRTNLALRIAADDVALAQDGDRYIGQVRVTIVFYRKDGSAMGIAAVPLKLDYDAGQREKALRDGIEFDRSLNMDGVGLIRAVVFDFGSDAVGSLIIPR